MSKIAITTEWKEMPLTEEDKQAMLAAKDYAVRVIKELAVPDASLETWKTTEIDEAMDIIADYCNCLEKDYSVKAMKKGHMMDGPTGPYGR